MLQAPRTLPPLGLPLLVAAVAVNAVLAFLPGAFPITQLTGGDQAEDDTLSVHRDIRRTFVDEAGRGTSLLLMVGFDHRDPEDAAFAAKVYYRAVYELWPHRLYCANTGNRERIRTGVEVLLAQDPPPGWLFYDERDRHRRISYWRDPRWRSAVILTKTAAGIEIEVERFR